MNGRPSFAARPGAAEAWVREKAEAPTPKAELYPARLTLDISKALRGRIKVAAFQRGVTVAEMLRDLLEAAFPDGGGAP